MKTLIEINPRSYVFLLVVLLMTSTLHCNKESPEEPELPIPCEGKLATELPELTFEGKNTAGCYLNGDLWVPHTGIYYGDPPIYDSIEVVYNTVQANSPRVFLRFFKRYAYECDTLDEMIGITAVLTEVNEIRPVQNSLVYSGSNYGGLCDKLENESHFIEILHIDTINRIVSGRFGFSAISYFGDTLRFTEGRFDVKGYKDNL